jgi:transformation/transcription domain-associated protein
VIPLNVDARHLLKTLLHTFRSILTCIRQADQPTAPPNGEMLAKFFRHTMRCLAVFESTRDLGGTKEAIELTSQILLQFEPHVFSEIWTNHMEFFMQESVKGAHPFSVLQMLITHESVSHQLVGITLKHLMKNLSDLGGPDRARAALMVRMFKMSFLAINSYNTSNESVLVPHLQKFIIDSFTFAAQSDEPAIYYQILRSLFR